MREEEEEPFAPSLGDDPLDLRGYVRVLGRNKSKILAAGVLGAILSGVGGLFLLEDTYTVSARDYAYDYSYEDESDDHPLRVAAHGAQDPQPPAPRTGAAL